MCCYSIKQLTLFCTKSLKLRGTVIAPALRIEGWNNKYKLGSICLPTGVFSKCRSAFEHSHMTATCMKSCCGNRPTVTSLSSVCSGHVGFKFSPLIWYFSVLIWFWSASLLTDDSDLLPCSHLILIYFSILIWFWSTSPFSSNSHLLLHSHLILIYFSILIWFQLLLHSHRIWSNTKVMASGNQVSRSCDQFAI